MPSDGWTAAAENKPDLGSLGLNQCATQLGAAAASAALLPPLNLALDAG